MVINSDISIKMRIVEFEMASVHTALPRLTALDVKNCRGFFKQRIHQPRAHERKLT